MVYLINGLQLEWHIPEFIYESMTEFWKYVWALDGLLPVGFLLDCFYLIVGFEIAMFLIKLLISALNWLRGAGPLELE